MENKEDLINFLGEVKQGIKENEWHKVKQEKARLITQACNCGFIETNLQITPIGLNYLQNNSICF